MAAIPAATTVSSQLRQAFFIGDGRTGTGSGTVQPFVLPAGATRLLLPSSDGIGAHYNNVGSFAVVVTDAVAAPAIAADIPVDAPWALSLTMILLLSGGIYALRRRAAPPRS